MGGEGIPTVRALRLFAFYGSACSIFLSVSAYPDSSTQTNGRETKDYSSSKGSTTLLICLAAVAIALLLFFLFKLWQKKKRDEQYARLLRLFEEDDELELELGLRD